MTNTAQKAQDFPVYFGWDAPSTDPAGSIADVAQVITAMSFLLNQQRDPNDLGENPDSDERMGIHFIFKACAKQLEATSRLLSEHTGTSGSQYRPETSYPILPEADPDEQTQKKTA
ncbi:hypothetical protein [Ruegeria arenilitoris]|uniref:hypothetical protein n=1 Tax=Ruegeria arenilitoris TaxID=1173585 RepID=UPI00147F33D0|nr:hypothetical protein [Ruegeria arenilitoris]